MASREAMMDTIQQAYDARARGDVNGLMAAFHPDCAFELKGEPKQVQVCGRTEGHANVTNTLAALTEGFEFLERDIVSSVVEGDRAVVHSRVKVKFIPKGTTFVTDILDAFTFQDGKIVQLVEFADTALMKSIVEG